MKTFSLTSSSLASLFAVLSLTATAQAQTILMDDATVVTNDSQGQITADVLIIDGAITAIGTELAPPVGTAVETLSGQWITPGLFHPFSRVGLVDISLEARTNDSNVKESPTSVSDKASESFNPKAAAIDITRVEGITHAAIATGADKTIFGGLGFIANMSGDFNSVEKDAAFVYAHLGESGAQSAGGTRAASFSQLRAALDDARYYNIRFDGPDDGDTLSRRDARALIPAIQGRIPLVIMADRAADMMNIVDLKTDYPDLNLIIVGATEGWMIADQLAAADIKVMIDPQENLPGSFERVNARSDSANLLKDAGVDFAIMNRSDSLTHQARLLPQHAGNAVGNGLDWESAFAAITSVPARWFGLSTGTLSVGSDNFVIWNGDPLELTNAPTHMVINGDIQSLESRQTKLRDRYHPHHTDTRPHKYRN